MRYILVLMAILIANNYLFSKDVQPLAAFKIDSLWYIIDYNGNTITNPLKLKEILAYSEGFYVVSMDYENKLKYGFMTNDGQVALTNFDEVRPFMMGMAVVGKDFEVSKDSTIRMYGYMNNKGQVLVQPKYLEAYNFCDSLAWVMNYHERGYIDMNGKFKLKLKTNDFGNNFMEGLASFSDTSGHFGFINEKGEIVFGLNWDDAGNFVEGRAKVNKMGMYGFIDTTGKLIIKHAYDFANDFSNGYAFVGIPGESMYKPQWSLINKSGARMFDFKYDDVRDFAEGLAAVKEGNKWKYIDPQDKQVIKTEYDEAEQFQNGLAYVYNSGLKISGFIDPLGELLISIPLEATEIIDLRLNKKVK